MLVDISSGNLLQIVQSQSCVKSEGFDICTWHIH